MFLRAHSVRRDGDYVDDNNDAADVIEPATGIRCCHLVIRQTLNPRTPRDKKATATKSNAGGALCVCHMAEPAAWLVFFSWLEPFDLASSPASAFHFPLGAWQTHQPPNKQTLLLLARLASHESVVFTIARFFAFFVYGIINPFS